MPDFRLASCRICGGHRSVVGPISWGRMCANCGDARVISNMRQLRAHEGEFAERHRRGIVESFGGVLLDDAREQT